MAIGMNVFTFSVLPASLSVMIRSKRRSARSAGVIWLISGARGMAPDGALTGAVGSVAFVWLATLRPPKRCPTTSATNATKAMAATAQGSPEAKPRFEMGVAPAGVPQRWQKRAPGVSAVPQPVQDAPASAVPQEEQNRPVAAAPQFGQVDVWGGVMRQER